MGIDVAVVVALLLVAVLVVALLLVMVGLVVIVALLVVRVALGGGSRSTTPLTSRTFFAPDCSMAESTAGWKPLR